MQKIIMDFETRSACDLKRAGGYKYSLDPSTQPTCLAFKIRGNPTVYFLPFQVVNRHWDLLPQQLKDIWTNAIAEKALFIGHNVFFERCIYDNILVKRYGWPAIHPRQWRCTAAKAAACALPRNLEGAGEALKLRIQKDRRGYSAMMATCKPTRRYNEFKKLDDSKHAWTARQREKARTMGWPVPPPMFLEYDEAPDVWQTLYTYCKIDVKTEELLDQSLPDLPPNEQEIWFLNQKLNWRGLRVDMPTIKKIVDIMAVESKKKLKELDQLTMGLVTKPGARRSILEFLALDGIELPDIKAKTVDDALRGGFLSDDMQRLLEIRKALSMTSTKKYQAFLNRANADGRVRDILMYHGASTGRDTGTGVQPHNFPRGVIKVDKHRPYALVNNVAECHPDMLRILYGETLPMVFSSILRNMIIPSEGKELFVADFSKIEVAVLWWVADNWPGLEVLKAGKDPYKYQASANTGKPYEEIEDEGDDRQLGKAQILGGGFGMGWEKFQQTAWDMYRLKLTEEQSRAAITSYRETNEAVPLLWKLYEKAAIKAIEDGETITVGKCKFFCQDNFLWIQLPSGRRLAYREPQIAWRVRRYEKKVKTVVDGVEVITVQEHFSEPMKTVEFWAVNSKTKKWNLERTWGGTLTENIVQAIARDLMMNASLRLEKNGYLFLLAVHDEGITEKDIGKGNLVEFTKIMTERPTWADEHLPLDAKGWRGERYRK